MDLFRISEDLDNIDGLHMIHKIVRGISKYSPDHYAINTRCSTRVITDWFLYIFFLQFCLIVLKFLRRYLAMT